MNLRESWSLMKGGGGTGGRMASSKQTNRTWLLALFFMACSFFPVILSSDLPAGVLKLKPLTVSLNEPVNISLIVKNPKSLHFTLRSPSDNKKCLPYGSLDYFEFTVGDQGCTFYGYWKGERDKKGQLLFLMDEFRNFYTECVIFSPNALRDCGVVANHTYDLLLPCMINPAGGAMDVAIKGNQKTENPLKCKLTMEINGDLNLAGYEETTAPPVEEEDDNKVTDAMKLPTDGANKISYNFNVVWMLLAGTIGLIFPWVLYG